MSIGELGADAERLDQLAGYLRVELSEIDGVACERLRSAGVPEGARGVDLAAAGAVVVSLAKSGALKSLMDAVRRWLERSPQRGRSIRVQLDGDVLELSNASVKVEADLVALFVARHS